MSKAPPRSPFPPSRPPSPARTSPLPASPPSPRSMKPSAAPSSRTTTSRWVPSSPRFHSRRPSSASPAPSEDPTGAEPLTIQPSACSTSAAWTSASSKDSFPPAEAPTPTAWEAPSPAASGTRTTAIPAISRPGDASSPSTSTPAGSPGRAPSASPTRSPPGKQDTGRPNIGGPIATAGGLVFIGATDDNRFRAFDAKTGKELWATKLGAAAHSVPSTYQGADGKQYVVISAAGGTFLNDPITDDSVTAFALSK